MEIKALLQGTECSSYLKIGRNEIKVLQTNLPEVKATLSVDSSWLSLWSLQSETKSLQLLFVSA